MKITFKFTEDEKNVIKAIVGDKTEDKFEIVERHFGTAWYVKEENYIEVNLKIEFVTAVTKFVNEYLNLISLFTNNATEFVKHWFMKEEKEKEKTTNEKE